MTYDEAVTELKYVREMLGSDADFTSAVVAVLSATYDGVCLQIGRRRNEPKSKLVGRGVGRRRG